MHAMNDYAVMVVCEALDINMTYIRVHKSQYVGHLWALLKAIHISPCDVLLILDTNFISIQFDV